MAFLMAFVVAAAVSTCPITQPGLPFVPPAPYPIEPPGRDAFWHGSPTFWTMLDAEPRWRVGGPGSLSAKVFWWRPGFNGAIENFPDLTVTIRSLDTGEQILVTRKATNAHHGSFGGWAMLTGVTVPSPGCWEVTGEHRGETLSFIVSVH